MGVMRLPHREPDERELASLFRALAHPDRVRIVEELQSGEKDVNSLSEQLGARQPRISQHLSTLKSHHMVEERREGRHVYYRLALPEIAAWILEGLNYLSF